VAEAAQEGGAPPHHGRTPFYPAFDAWLPSRRPPVPKVPVRNDHDFRRRSPPCSPRTGSLGGAAARLAEIRLIFKREPIPAARHLSDPRLCRLRWPIRELLIKIGARVIERIARPRSKQFGLQGDDSPTCYSDLNGGKHR
jgi:hypothetical protein